MNKSESVVEIWKPVKGYGGFYEVSNTGKIRSIDRVVIGRRYKGRELAIQNNPNGYLAVALYKQGVSKTRTIHRMVCEVFHKNEENKKCVNHIDGDKFNNAATNLEWVTHSENAEHAFKTGLRTLSDKNRLAISESNTRKKSKPVIRTGKGLDEKWYRSIKDASLNESVNASDIARTCKGYKKQAGGFDWRYGERREEA